jgi:hypothetical protein
MDYLETVIKLPPGPLSADALRATLRLVFEELRWFEPTHCGRVTPDKPLPKSRPVIDAIMELSSGDNWLAVGSKGDRHVLMLSMDKPGERSHLGRLTWLAPPGLARDPAWREAHAAQVAMLMRQLGSAYAYATLANAARGKTHHETTDQRGFAIETFTVRDHSEGLVGLFWRNFFAAPFQALFGDRLAGVVRYLDDIALVEPYPTPDGAFTEEGRRRENELVARLGADCFYDHERRTPPTRRPVLT